MPSPRLQKITPAAILVFAITACSPSALGASPTLGPTSVVIQYQTPTVDQIQTASVVPEQLPTTTPATYLVVEGDTFFSIAANLGIGLDALIAANPGVDPRLLTPGTSLILPSGGSTAEPSIATPTPVSLNVAETKCYNSAAGELWCFVPVENTLPSAVENLTAVVQLFDADGELLTTLDATPPINLLGTGQKMPLVAYSPDPPGGWATARGQLLSAYSLTEASDYYLSATISGSTIDISGNGLSANIAGRVEILNGQPGTIWVLAVAYDANGNVVGIRRWESENETKFAFLVYSLGPEIKTVDLLVEALP